MDEDNLLDYIDSDDFEDEKKGEDNPEAILSTDKDSEMELKVGAEFATIEKLQELYTKYAKHKGFQIRRRNSRKNVVQFVCFREGTFRSHKKRVIGYETPVAQTQPCTKTSKIGCLARLYCWLDSKSNKWRITKFFEHHNHEMMSPESLKYLRSDKNVTVSTRCLSYVLSDQGIGVGKVTDVLNAIPEGAGFTRKDCYNYMTRFSKQNLDCGDAQAVLIYCIRQQELDPNFRFAIQLDDDDKMLNFLWIDAKSRSAYEVFGDVVSFDTTYRTNKYNMPFAPFVGIDNHMHTILFGCAFLQDETDKSFVWLFNAWLHAMDEKAPSSFVTDQDISIMNAVQTVFPKTRHQLCLWDVVKKFSERLSHIYQDNTQFKMMLNQCIHDSLTVKAFEEAWTRLVIEFGLEGNDWLRQLFSIRHLWVPVFCKDVFFGGMNTARTRESINAFFDDFVHSGTMLQEFVHKYSQAIERRYETYRRSELDSKYKIPNLSLGMGLEEHAGFIYTSEIFNLFYTELSKCLAFSRVALVDGNPKRSYQVTNRLSKEDSVIVEYNMSTSDAKCGCMTFESRGILCRHILSVLFMHSVDQIPPQFILSRWTKNIGCSLWESPVAEENALASTLRGLKLKTICDSLSMICEQSEEIFKMVQKRMDMLLVAAKTKFNQTEVECVGSSNPQQTSSLAEQCSYNIQDPNVTQIKGRKNSSLNQSTRIRNGIGMSSNSTKRCSACFSSGHNRRTCPKIR